MKTLSAKDITEVSAEDVKVGMIVVEGLIVNVRREKGGKNDVMFFDHVDGTTTFSEVGAKVQVYAKMDQCTLEVILAASSEK